MIQAPSASRAADAFYQPSYACVISLFKAFSQLKSLLLHNFQHDEQAPTSGLYMHVYRV